MLLDSLITVQIVKFGISNQKSLHQNNFMIHFY